MTDRVDLTITGEVASLHLEPGDRVIVTINERVPSFDFAEAIREQLRAQFPDNEVIILQGITIAREAAR